MVHLHQEQNISSASGAIDGKCYDQVSNSTDFTLCTEGMDEQMDS